MNVEHGPQHHDPTDDLLLHRYFEDIRLSKDDDGDGEEGGVCFSPEEEDDENGEEGGVCFSPDEDDEKEDDGDGGEGGVCF